MIVMVLQILYERGQNRADLNKKVTAKLGQSVLLMILNCWSKGKLCWGRGSVTVLTGKKKRFWTLSKVVCIGFDRGNPAEDPICIQEKIKRATYTGSVYC